MEYRELPCIVLAAVEFDANVAHVRSPFSLNVPEKRLTLAEQVTPKLVI
jgi:hypothetical protein